MLPGKAELQWEIHQGKQNFRLPNTAFLGTCRPIPASSWGPWEFPQLRNWVSSLPVHSALQHGVCTPVLNTSQGI